MSNNSHSNTLCSNIKFLVYIIQEYYLIITVVPSLDTIEGGVLSSAQNIHSRRGLITWV